MEACRAKSAMRRLGGAVAMLATAASAVLPRSASRQMRTRRAPCLASPQAVAKPMPVFAPVITMIFSDVFIGRFRGHFRAMAEGVADRDRGGGGFVTA